MDKTKNILRGAVVLFIVAVMVFSSVAVANTTTKTKLKLYATGEGTGVGAKGNVVWDNGMHYEGFVASQWDASMLLDPIAADDFNFEVTTEVTDVHWIGGYWNPVEDGDFDWNVSFYRDRGDGMAPGAKTFEQVFPNAEVHETFIEEIDGGWYFSYWVDLVDAITFTGGQKYWISIQGVGAFPPQSHWSGHGVPIVLHQGVFKSDYFGHPDWVNISVILGGPADGCFQLTGDGESVVPDLDCDGDIRWDQVPPGTIVNSTFTVINSGNIGSMLEWKVSSYPEWGTNWTLNWTFYDDGGFVGTTMPEEVFVEVVAPDKKGKTFEGEILLVNSENAADTCSINVICNTPRSRAMINTPFLRIFEQFPNLFPILRQLFGL